MSQMSSRVDNLPSAAGIVAAVGATILGALLAPRYLVTPASLFERAASYSLLVFGAAAGSVYVAYLIRAEGDRIESRDVAIGTAAFSLWLPVLFMFAVQRSWMALVAWAIFICEAARFIALLKQSARREAGVPEPGLSLPKVLAAFARPGNSNAQSPSDLTFSVLKRDLPAAVSICGAFLLQGSICAAIGGYITIAGLMYFLGTGAIAYRGMRMLEQWPALNFPSSKRILTELVLSTALILFAWLPYTSPGISGTSGNFPAGSDSGLQSGAGNRASARSIRTHAHRGDVGTSAWLKSLFSSGSERSDSSFAIAKQFLGSTFSQPSVKPMKELKNLQNSKTAAAFVVLGPVFPAVQLYPEQAGHPKLIAPRLSFDKGFGTTRPDPLSIPFEGVYWFWNGPTEQPPSKSVVLYGSPSERFFRSTDGAGISMEAHQNLGFAVDPRLYSAIEIVLQNADPFPNTVSIALRVRDTSAAGTPARSLGLEKLSGSSLSKTQTLTFWIPGSVERFDELWVSYYLKGPRNDRSARIAIELFRLVPR